MKNATVKNTEPTRDQRVRLDELCEDHGTLAIHFTEWAKIGRIMHITGEDGFSLGLDDNGNEV